MASKGDKSKVQIIETAINMYSDIGYDRTSFQKISKKLKLSHTAPIYHFKNKLGLFKAVLDYVFTRAEKIVTESYSESDGLEEKLAKFIKGHITWTYIFKKEANTFCLLANFASFESEFAEIYKDLTDRKISQLKEILIQEPNFDFSENQIEFKAQVLIDYLYGLILFRVSGYKSAPSVENINQRIEWIVSQTIKEN